jgi:hypothetical protein
MNKKGFALIFCICCVLIKSGCNVNENDDHIQPNSFLSSFESLTAEKDTISRGESTSITAKAVGNNISYEWAASEGPILGEGSHVIYVASPCCYGDITITCEARAKNGSEKKSLVITVLK